MNKTTHKKCVVQTCTAKSQQKRSKRRFLYFNSENLSKLNRTELDCRKFQRIARKFFITSRLGQIVVLRSHKSAVRINFKTDDFGYISISTPDRETYLHTKVHYNKDVLIKLLNHNML